MISNTSDIKKKIAAMNKNPNLSVAAIEAIKGTNEAKFGVSLSMISKLIFSITSKIPATTGVRHIKSPIVAIRSFNLLDMYNIRAKRGVT